MTDTEIAKAFNRLRGRLAGFIESLDLPSRDERVLVSTMKSMTYDVEREIKAGAGDAGSHEPAAGVETR